MPSADDPIDTELQRAKERILSMRGQAVPAITVDGLEPTDAPFLGANISKLSPFISNLLERRILEELTKVPGEHGYTWKRQDPGFPDAGIVNPDGAFTGDGIEVKAWFPLSTEIASRFRTSQLHLAGKRVLVALVSWAMTEIISGQPFIVAVDLFDAYELAVQRDAKYHKPPRYLVEHPTDTSERGAQLQMHTVSGYVIQDPSLKQLERADRSVRAYGSSPIPHDEMTMQLVEELRSRLAYKNDSNFGKLDRLDHPGVEAFKQVSQSFVHKGLSLGEWHGILRLLTSEKASATDRAWAEAAVRELYPDPA